MNIQLCAGSIIEIQPHCVLTLSPDVGARLVAERGTLWVTDTSGQDDWLLEAGQSYLPPAGATVYVEAFDDGALRLVKEH